MIIEFINYPYVFTDTGARHLIKDIKGIPVVGSTLDDDLNVTSKTSDSDCVSGVCPVK